MSDVTSEPKARLPRPRPEHLLPIAAAVAGAAAAWWGTRRRNRVEDAGEITTPRIMTPEDFDRLEPNRGRCARYPWVIPPLGWKDILWRTYRESGRDRLPALAGGVTFFAVPALLTAATAFVLIYSLFANPQDVQALVAQLSAIFPHDVVELMSRQMNRISGQRAGAISAASIATIAVSAWSANAGMKALMDGLNIAYGETEKRQYIPRTLVSYGATVMALVFLTLITLILVAAPAVLGELGVHGLGRVWVPFRWVVVLAIAAMAFALVYKYGPSRAPARWRWVTGGGALAALLWMVGSLGFSWYVNNIAHLDIVFGSLGAVIALMVWVWFSTMVVLIGAELNAEIEHQTAIDTTTGAPLPMGERGAVMADTVGRAFTVSPREAVEITAAFCGRQVRYTRNFFGHMLRPVSRLISFFF
jgi:membrane protein